MHRYHAIHDTVEPVGWATEDVEVCVLYVDVARPANGEEQHSVRR